MNPLEQRTPHLPARHQQLIFNRLTRNAHRFLTPSTTPPVLTPVNLNPYSRTMQHLVMLSRLLQCLIVVSLLLSRIPTSMIYGGPSNIWSCFQDHFKTLYYFDGPCFQAQFSITEFYLGSPVRQKRSQKSWAWTGK